jgi:hypothetical protein
MNGISSALQPFYMPMQRQSAAFRLQNGLPFRVIKAAGSWMRG